MEEKKHLLHYLEQVFVIFGVSILIVEVICRIFGEEARQYSTMFELGNAGVPFHTVLEYLLSSICITALRFVFYRCADSAVVSGSADSRYAVGCRCSERRAVLWIWLVSCI